MSDWAERRRRILDRILKGLAASAGADGYPVDGYPLYWDDRPKPVEPLPPNVARLDEWRAAMNSREGSRDDVALWESELVEDFPPTPGGTEEET